MTSTRPYLIRAFYDWIIDNQCTPYLVVKTDVAGVDVPQEYAQGGQIVLNIAMNAVQGLVLGEYAIEFQTRFANQIRSIYAPTSAIVAIYAKENGKGMVFPEEEHGNDEPHAEEKPLSFSSPFARPDLKSIEGCSKTSADKIGKKPSKRPHLTIVK